MEAEDHSSSSSSSEDEKGSNNNNTNQETQPHHHHEFREKNIPTNGARKYREETKAQGWLSKKLFGKKEANLDAITYTIYLNDSNTNEKQQFRSNIIIKSKYTWWNFFFKCIWDRVANIYFLFIILISYIPDVSPLLPAASIIPLVIVLGLSCIKEGLLDIKRHREDKKMNFQPFQVIRDGQLQSVFSKDVRPGDIAYVKAGEAFPADLILLSSTFQDGHSYVETCNIDGETNLKMRKALPATCKIQSIEQLHQIQGYIECEAPNERLYQFKGRLVIKNAKGKLEDHSLTPEQFLHRGASLRNTESVYGLVLYVGVETKLYLNQQRVYQKYSTSEKYLNKLVLGTFLFSLFLSIIDAIAATTYRDKFQDDSWYLSGLKEYKAGLYFFRAFVTHVILFNKIIPIALYITTEVSQAVQARFIESDKDFILDLNNIENTSAKCRSPNLNEDLGRIQHIFSDKTGTLTENLMKFHLCSIRERVYDQSKTPAVLSKIGQDASTPKEEADKIREFLTVLAVCNTVVPEEKDGAILYQAESPDEKALVEAAAENQVILLERSNDDVQVSVWGHKETWQIMDVIEFTSARRRMSIVVKDPQGRILLLSKGADVTMFQLMADTKENKDLIDISNQHLQDFSKLGLRTLVVGYKEIPSKEYKAWHKKYHKAKTSIQDRDTKVEEAAQLMETNLNLVGCTAIDDKLQELVPETIDFLMQAGIQIWVLTGDKQETAINIAYSSKLVTPDMELLIIKGSDAASVGQHLQQALLKFESLFNEASSGTSQGRKVAMAIDGSILNYALDNHTVSFLKLGSICRSVICSRVTPLQKALVVRCVKTHEKKISLSVGDGANDCSMILEAHVGVGIFGKEGNQAALIADYAVHRFHHLKKLICVHGRYNYLRNAVMMQYMIYKSVVYTIVKFFFSFYAGNAGQTLIDPWVLAFYNLLYTAFPAFTYAIFEKDVNEHLIYKYPQLYKYIQSGPFMTPVTFFWWIVEAVWHAAVSFFTAYWIFKDDGVLQENGQTGGMWAMGVLASTIAVVVVNLRMAVETKHWTKQIHWSIWGSIGIYLVFLLLYCAFVTALPNNMFFQIYYLLSTASFWFAMLLVVFVAIVPQVSWKYVSQQLWPKDWQIIRERHEVSKGQDIELESM
eukprot:CAMPEP_0168578090 /NCGR_PEP_ID=MMETSP0413-20121227/21145_1 /TAXON_ID=136452 /ORGANISM="Filamoeba nolandi, Strain NC-AS-23-1" /LENGTH=1137 /DNA_ID=CAMNT_0008611909 /DNA_START=1 /DNA_END=3414 /DNA_ORIENTATION=+